MTAEQSELSAADKFWGDSGDSNDISIINLYAKRFANERKTPQSESPVVNNGREREDGGVHGNGDVTNADAAATAAAVEQRRMSDPT